MIVSDLDRLLFQAINGTHSNWADSLMWLISTRWLFIPLYLYLIWIVYKKFPGTYWILFLSVASMILVSDQLSVAVKFWVERPRPCHDALLSETVHLVNNKCGGLYGFYSSHASNTAALAWFLGLCLRSRIWFNVLIFWSLLVGYSRIYLGNHYPSDVLVGWSAGAILAWLTYAMVRRFLESRQ